MDKLNAIIAAKTFLLGQNRVFENESWIVLAENWELNIWQDEETGEWRHMVFFINSDGDIEGEGTEIFLKEKDQ